VTRLLHSSGLRPGVTARFTVRTVILIAGKMSFGVKPRDGRCQQVKQSTIPASNENVCGKPQSKRTIPIEDVLQSVGSGAAERARAHVFFLRCELTFAVAIHPKKGQSQLNILDAVLWCGFPPRLLNQATVILALRLRLRRLEPPAVLHCLARTAACGRREETIFWEDPGLPRHGPGGVACRSGPCNCRDCDSGQNTPQPSL